MIKKVGTEGAFESVILIVNHVARVAKPSPGIFRFPTERAAALSPARDLGASVVLTLVHSPHDCRRGGLNVSVRAESFPAARWERSVGEVERRALGRMVEPLGCRNFVNRMHR